MDVLELLANLKKFEYNFDYPFKTKIDLYPFQKKGVMFLFMSPGSILGDGTGLGKTIQTISLSEELIGANPKQNFLIFTIPSAIKQWFKEINKFTDKLSPVFVETCNTRAELNYNKANYEAVFSPQSLAKEGRVETYYQWGRSFNTLIVHYPLLYRDIDYIGKQIDYIKENNGQFSVIFDEASILRNIDRNLKKIKKEEDIKNKTAYYAKVIASLTNRSYALTATPVQTKLDDLYGIYSVINPKLLGDFNTFRQNYTIVRWEDVWIKVFNPKTGRKEPKARKVPKVVAYQNLDHLKNRIAPFFIARKKKEVSSQLPDLIQESFEVELGNTQKDIYRNLKNGFLFDDVGDDVDNEDAKLHPFQKLILMQQCSDSLELIPDANSKESTKLDELNRLVEDDLSNDKIVIFSHFKTMANIIYKNFEDKGYFPLKITGDENLSQRDANLQLFNTSDKHNILIITTAGNKALNIQAASYLIVFDLLWNYGEIAQLIGRLVRIGSKHEKVVVIYLLAEKTIDNYMYATLQRSQELIKCMYGDDVNDLKTPESFSVDKLKDFLRNDGFDK
jgi:non-specific serine/threonine protein kinase